MSEFAPLNFDARTVEPAGAVIPPEWYPACIVKHEIKRTSAGDGQYVSFTFQIASGTYQNRKLTENLNLWNKNEQTVQIAKGQLSAICRAVNVLTLASNDDILKLYNKVLMIRVVVKKDDSFGDKNEIKAYKPKSAGPVPPVAQPATPIAAPAPGAAPFAPSVSPAVASAPADLSVAGIAAAAPWPA